jgi:outer membrane protein OmpA-like peptidoglycan-associated protein
MAGDQSPFQSGMDCCFTASATQKGQDINVAALVSALQNQGSLNCPHPGQKDPISVNPGEVPVGVDLAAAKAVEINMVVVRAADIADALAAKGTFDLYGILFDVDKTDIKPESGKTLDQVAALLKVDRSLKLEISGHADNSGDKSTIRNGPRGAPRRSSMSSRSNMASTRRDCRRKAMATPCP